MINVTRERIFIESPISWSFLPIKRLHLSLISIFHGSLFSFTASLRANPGRPPLLGGKELAPIPMRLRSDEAPTVEKNDENLIRKVLSADQFDIHSIDFKENHVSIAVTNTKFRSTAQAVGRVASTLQRFSSDAITSANISFISGGMQTANYYIDLEKVTEEQFSTVGNENTNSSIFAINADTLQLSEENQRFSWGVGPYFTHRLFNPDLPLSLETGIEVEAGYQISTGLKISGAVRKSILTNLTDNKRRSNSKLPRVHSDWPLYDFAGQSGHIHSLTLSYFKNLTPKLYGRAQVGFLNHFAGIGAEIVYKPAHWPIGIGLDIHRVRKRDYKMRFDTGL